MDGNHSGTRAGGRKRSRGDTEGLFDWNLKSGRILFSPRWLALVGCEDHEVGSQPEGWFQRVHPEDRAEFLREIDGARAGESTAFACRYRLRHKDGTYRWMACRGTVVRDRTGHPIRLTGSQSDVTVETVTDRLTGLPNRLRLLDRVTHSIERAHRYNGFEFAVLLIDLGRPGSARPPSATATSDPLLTAVARRLETCLRNPGLMLGPGRNDLVARMDGDNFAILLDGLKDICQAKAAADRILGELLNPIRLGEREVRLSASIGVAVSATGYTTADQMLHDAEVAQHRARMLGGSHCEIFDTAILKSEQAELQLENDFEAALQRHEFVLWFQPIVSLDSNQVIAFEALVRWQHPVLGIIPPGDFITLAERTGFILPLGNWILREACRRLREWDADLPESRDVSVAVNISSVQAGDPSIQDQVAAALRDSGLEPRRLVLELTEGIAMANPTAITTLLMRLRAIGVRISVDDFGTGYSSLSYLRQFPIDTLKIDRSFVRGMVTNKGTAEIVAGVINMAEQLGLHVVAEGIEHEDQCARLRALKCHAGQGSLFSTPLDVEAATGLLKTGLPPRPDREQPTTSVWKAPRHSQLVGTARRLVTRRRASFAAAALLISAGFVVVTNVPAASVGSPPSLTGEHQPTAAPAAAAVPVLPPAGVGEGVNSPATPAIGIVPPTGAISASSSIVPRGPIRSTSVKVVHLHRLGSCRGRLHVTPGGVAFVSETNGEEDAFTLKYSEFVDAVSDDTLILRSATKTYRFRAVASRGERNGLRDVSDTIARARR